jgi:phosphomevalonate kinase
MGDCQSIFLPTMTVISAPGKVLLAGGYLVLEQQYSGVVVAASSRFYTAIKDGQDNKNVIRVKSPQFIDARWVYNINIGETGALEVSQTLPDV